MEAADLRCAELWSVEIEAADVEGEVRDRRGCLHLRGWRASVADVLIVSGLSTDSQVMAVCCHHRILDDDGSTVRRASTGPVRRRPWSERGAQVATSEAVALHVIRNQ